MHRFRFSIRSFLVTISLLGCGLAAMASQARLATSLAYTAFLVLICLAATGAILAGQNRAFWLGFAVFGWTYWFVEFDTSGGSPPTASGSVAFFSPLGVRLNQPIAPPAKPGLVTGDLMELLETQMTIHRAIGSKVLAQWRSGSYYSGTITDAQNGQYLIVWDDGSPPQWTPPAQIAPNSPNLRIAAHATLGGLFAVLGGVLVAMVFGQPPEQKVPMPKPA